MAQLKKSDELTSLLMILERLNRAHNTGSRMANAEFIPYDVHQMTPIQSSERKLTFRVQVSPNG